MSQIEEKFQAKWEEIVSSSVDEQANYFLKAFVVEFSGQKFEEVLDLGQQFKKFLLKSQDSDLEEDRSLLFLEKKGEVHTASELRGKLKSIDVDNNHRMAFLEYCLFKWSKTPAKFFAELNNPKRGGTEALERAIAEYRKVLAIKEEREKKMEDLSKESEKGGVKGNVAKNMLEQMKNEDTLALNKAELTAAANKRKAEKK